MAKQTLLYAAHVEQEAKMIDFNGWEMPLQYKTGIIKEHMAVREGVGVFDTTHMGEFALVAPDIRKALNSMLVGDFTRVKNGRMRYSFICDEQGGIIDDVVIFILNSNEAMICVNAGDIAGDYQALAARLPENTAIEDQSDGTGKIDIQGPLAYKVVEKLTGFDIRAMPFYSFHITEWQGSPLILSRSGYTGSVGAELFVDADALGQLWYYTNEAGKDFGILPCGLGARDTLRLEAGMPLYGHELSLQINPLMTGFTRLVSLNKEENFPGKEALKAYNCTQGKVLVGYELKSKRIAREGSTVYLKDRKVGTVTSGGPGIYIDKSIALGYIAADYAAVGTVVEIELGKKKVNAEIAKLPFYNCELLRTIEK